MPSPSKKTPVEDDFSESDGLVSGKAGSGEVGSASSFSGVVGFDDVSTNTMKPVRLAGGLHSSILEHLSLLPLKALLPLVISFILSFALVLLAGLSAHKFQLGARFSRILPSPADPIPDSISVLQPGVVVHVPHVDSMNPEVGEDWLLLNWIKLKKGILPDERVVLSAKYDPSSRIRPGYSVALRGGIDGVRPVVYWQNEEGDGRWFTFAPVQLLSREWYLLALSFRKGTLGMHVASASNPKSVSPLGGYDVGATVLPKNSSELIVGSFANGRFRGKLGPFGIVKGEELSKVLPELLKQAARKPGSMPTPPEKGSVVFWTDGSKDFGPAGLGVSTVFPGGRVKSEE